MDSRHKPATSVDSKGKVTKKYCDKVFRKHLAKALKLNQGEPGHIEKIRGNKHLQAYPPDKIIEFVNSVASDVQKHVENSITDPEVKNIFHLARIVDAVCGGNKPQELPSVMKFKSETEYINLLPRTSGVNFAALNRFLYTAVSGLPDCSNLDPKSQKVLYDTHAMLMKQIEHDATPEFLDEMKSKICAGYTDQIHSSISNLAEMFNDETLNPFNFPFEYLLNGTLPSEPIPEKSHNQADNASMINITVSKLPQDEEKEVVNLIGKRSVLN